ncbi:MAG: hypothetical protein HGN29_18080, partial [Asgard group archaeon]|nr:hypothetical protein [Asgard group archaeon]
MERKGDDTLRPADLETSLDISNLLYLENKESNVVVERTQKIQYADRPVNKAEDVLVINFQTGSDYISFKDSHLRLVLNLFKQDKTTPSVSGDKNTFGVWGSVLNIMRTIRIISRAGDVIAQVDSANLLNFYKVNYEHKERWKFQQGKALIGWTSSTGEHLNGTNEFLIPLQLICSFFELHSLSPSQLCKGMRLEISLENPAVAFVQPTPGQAADTLGTYTVTGCQLHLDSYSLT